MTLEEAKGALSAYLLSNRKSTVDQNEDGSLAIKTPWGDNTISLSISEYPTELFDALNSVILPERFSALWHEKTKDFEVIYTAVPLTGDQVDMLERKFKFTFKGRTYDCEFLRSSTQLLAIAEHLQPVGQSAKYRNLPTFFVYVHSSKDADIVPKIEGMFPISFWIRNFDCTEDTAVEICRHLNFYMSYYDTSSPTIDIHTPTAQAEKPRERFIAGTFPKTIISTEFLMHFWHGSRGGDFYVVFYIAFRF